MPERQMKLPLRSSIVGNRRCGRATLSPRTCRCAWRACSANTYRGPSWRSMHACCGARVLLADDPHEKVLGSFRPFKGNLEHRAWRISHGHGQHKRPARAQDYTKHSKYPHTRDPEHTPGTTVPGTPLHQAPGTARCQARKSTHQTPGYTSHRNAVKSKPRRMSGEGTEAGLE